MNTRYIVRNNKKIFCKDNKPMFFYTIADAEKFVRLEMLQRTASIEAVIPNS